MLAQSWHGHPTSREPRRNLRPRVACASKWTRVEALLRNRVFLAEYMRARAGWHDGDMVMFPLGNYWLRRNAQVPMAED